MVVININDILDTVLPSLGVPYYDGVPEFPEGEEPRAFCYYTLYSLPALRGDGGLFAVQWTVTLTVCALERETADTLSQTAVGLMEDAGFVWTGCTYTRDNDFPRGNLCSIDFKYIIERNE